LTSTSHYLTHKALKKSYETSQDKRAQALAAAAKADIRREIE